MFAIFGCAKGIESGSSNGGDEANTAGAANSTSGGSAALGGAPASTAGAPNSVAGGGGSASSSGGKAGASNVGGGPNGGGAGSGGKAGSSAQGGGAGAPSSGGTSSGGSTASAGQGAQLFSDDFEDGNATGWTVSGGTWAVIKDGSQVYAQQATGTSSNVLISANGSSAWTDQVLEVKLKVLAFGGQSTSYFAAIYARYDGADYYALALREDGHIAIRKDKSTLGNAVDAGIVAGTWYTLRFEVVGSSLKAYVNGVLEDSETDSSLASGGIALSAVNATAEFDDVKVTLP